jgi:hypothetical protein
LPTVTLGLIERTGAVKTERLNGFTRPALASRSVPTGPQRRRHLRRQAEFRLGVKSGKARVGYLTSGCDFESGRCNVASTGRLSVQNARSMTLETIAPMRDYPASAFRGCPADRPVYAEHSIDRMGTYIVSFKGMAINWS